MTSLGQHLENYIQNIDNSTNTSNVSAVLGDYIQFLGFEFYALQILQGKNFISRQHRLTNYPKEWVDRYISQNYVLHDMVSARAVRSVMPFAWTDTGMLSDFTPDQQRVFNEASEFGLLSGGAVPLHGPQSLAGHVAVATHLKPAEFSKFFALRQHELQLIAAHAFNKLYQLGAFDTQPMANALTPREREIMSWTAQGKTAPEISKILNISSQTVKNQIKSASLKLNAINKTQAATTALVNGLIVIA